jgi:choline-glycine betaine transporter
LFVVGRGSAALGSYALHSVPMSLFRGPDWVAAWTVWNWSWWFSWAPFAGLFLAALSRGRKVRTVVFTGVVATSAATAVWFLLMGGTSLQLQHAGAADVLGAIASRGGSVAVSSFPLFGGSPPATVVGFTVTVTVLPFPIKLALVGELKLALVRPSLSSIPTPLTVVRVRAFRTSRLR